MKCTYMMIVLYVTNWCFQITFIICKLHRWHYTFSHIRVWINDIFCAVFEKHMTPYSNKAPQMPSVSATQTQGTYIKCAKRRDSVLALRLQYWIKIYGPGKLINIYAVCPILETSVDSLQVHTTLFWSIHNKYHAHYRYHITINSNKHLYINFNYAF